MIPSSSTLHQKLTPPSPGSAFLYLLISQQHPGAFKLGVTKHPAMRFDSLTKHFGKFDLQASALVVAAGRRAALDLEGVLEAVFSAPSWRIKPQLPPAKNARLRRSNGNNEWYHMAAFEPMTTLIGAMIERDENCTFHRFKLVPNIQDSDLWRKHLCDAGVQTQFRTASDIELDAKERLEKSESNFAAVQAWMEPRRQQLVSSTPFVDDGQGNRRRTLFFRGAPVLESEADNNEGGEWEELASACIVSCRSGRSFTNFTYFGSVTMSSVDASTYSVEFLLTPSFQRAYDEHPSLRNLLVRIINWLDALPLPA